MVSDDRALMQDALDAAKMYPGLDDDMAALEQKLLSVVRCVTRAALRRFGDFCVPRPAAVQRVRSFETLC